MITVRDARLSDAPRLRAIYDYYVRHTAITFDYETPTPDEFAGRMRAVMARWPYLVVQDGDAVMGYAYAGPFKDRAAYDWSCEMTIYLDHEAQHRGLGRILYGALEDALKGMGILNLYACIGVPERDDEYLTRNSEGFHAHLGYRTVGTFHRCGYKFGRWYDMIWMEKIVAPHEPDQPPVRPYAPSPR